MENLKSNPYSHYTAKERNSLSFPVRNLLKKNLLVGKVLDFGCGYGKDVELLKEKGIDIIGYDKHYFPVYPKVRFDTIICFYVLNVLLPKEQTEVLMQLSRLVKPSGKVFIAVRRDVKYEGFRMHRIHQKKTYQCNVVLNSKSIFQNDFCEIYEYRHYNQLNRKASIKCPFCNPDKDREIIVESATAYSIFDKFPVNKGHALIIPKKHRANYFDLTFKEQLGSLFVLNKVKSIFEKRFKPDGFNVGINVGRKAGQTVDHAHIHLIPRYKGDIEDPRGGIRRVIPGKKTY